MINLNGKAVVVTGASKGIGNGIVRLLIEYGANVILNYRTDQRSADEFVAEAKGPGKVMLFKADVSHESEAKLLIDFAVKSFGKLDALINNAGVYEFKPLIEITEAHLEHHYAVNVKGLLFTTKAAVLAFGDQGGSIINVSTAGTFNPLPNTVAYSSSKGAVDVITRQLAQELGSKQIRVNTIAPGLVETEGLAPTLSDEFRTMFIARTPMGRAGKPKDIAGLAAFLVSDDSAWITGQYISADGGWRS